MADKKVIKRRGVSRNEGYTFGKDQGSGDKVVEVSSEAMSFVSLHHHSTFSYADGLGMPEDHVMRAAELGMEALALTEHGNVSSHVKLEQAANDVGIKPIFGCELYQGVAGTGKVTENNPQGFAQGKNHLTVLAADQEGYRNLLRVVSDGWRDENFFRNMTVTNQMLEEHSEGLIVTSGCTASILATSLIGGKWIEPSDAGLRRAAKVAARYKEMLGDRFYLEVQMFPELPEVRQINEAYERISERLDIPLVATADVHYYRPDQARIRQVLHSIGRAKDFTELGQEWNYDIDSSHPMSDRNVIKRLRATGLSKRAAEQALASTGEIAGRCNVTLPKAEMLRYPLREGEASSTDELMMMWLRAGWKKRGLTKWPKAKQEEYRSRLMYELEIIREKGFADYFLIVSDMVKYAKREEIPVGPARGSAAASVLCWLLEITEVDPLRDDIPDLIFERFIDRNRADLPDIDLDFDDELREDVKDYMAVRYGVPNVSNIGTFTAFKGKNSLDDAGKVHRVPQVKVDALKNLLIERSSADLRASATIEDTVEMFEQAAEIIEEYPDLMDATLLEGNLKTFGVHAAGLVVANQPLQDICAVYERKGKPPAVSLDKYDAEYLNLLKIDTLGLSTMGLIRIALREIGMSLSELYALPLDDPETLQGFRDNDVVSVFQFDGRATRSINEAVCPDNFAEIADINALSRPGPLHSGATAEYIDVKHGRREPTQYHPMVDEITKGTHGCIIYQEQILRIVREVGNFDWTAAAYIRKIISKKLGEQEFNRQWSMFHEGATANGLDEDTTRKVWNNLITSGAYAFNAAHCVSYGLLAYWTMWLKRNHPQAFFVAALEKYGDKKNSFDIKKQDEILRDTVKFGRNLRVLPPHPNDSGVSWSTSGRRTIRAGFAQVHGLGEKIGQSIIDYRDEHGDFGSWKDLQKVKGIGAKTVDKIVEFTEKDDPFDLNLLSRTLDKIRDDLKPDGELGRIHLPYPTHTSIEVPYERGEDTEVVWLGTIRTRNLKDLFELHYSRTGEELDPEDVRSPHLNEYVSMIGEDDTDILTVAVSRFKYDKFKKAVWDLELNKDLVLIRGVKLGFQARRAIYISDLWVIDPEG